MTRFKSKEVGEGLGIGPELARHWKREHEQTGAGGFSGHGNANLTAGQKEVVVLKKALKEAQIERDILKKAVSTFSRNDGKYFSS